MLTLRRTKSSNYLMANDHNFFFLEIKNVYKFYYKFESKSFGIGTSVLFDTLITVGSLTILLFYFCMEYLVELFFPLTTIQLKQFWYVLIAHIIKFGDDTLGISQLRIARCSLVHYSHKNTECKIITFNLLDINLGVPT